MIGKAFRGVVLGTMLGVQVISGPTGCSNRNVSIDTPVRLENVGDTTITVSAKSTVKVTPDVAEIRFGVETKGKDIAKAQESNKEKVNKVIESLKALGIDEKLIQTESININPEFSYNRDYERYDYETEEYTITGYRASTQLSITGVEIDKVSDIVDAGIDAGASRINGLEFKVSNYSEKYREALGEAVKTSQEKAEVMLNSANTSNCYYIKGIKEIVEGYENDYVAYSKASNSIAFAEDDAMSSFNAEEMMPGEEEIEANVTVTYIIGERASVVY